MNWKKIAAALVLVAAIVTVYLSPLREWLTVANLRVLLGQIGSLWYAPALFILAFALSCVLVVPASVFIIAAGLIWGWQLGGLYAFLGAVLGATASFWVSRYLGGGFLQRLGPRAAGIGRILENSGFGSMLILRLIPLFPFAVINYGAGVARVRGRDYVAATAVGVIPSIFVVTYSADALFRGTLSGPDAFKRLVVVCLSVALLVGIPMLLKKRAARALHLEGSEPEAEV